MFFKKRSKEQEQELKEIIEYIEHKERMGFCVVGVKIRYKENVKILRDADFSVFRQKGRNYLIMWKQRYSREIYRKLN